MLEQYIYYRSLLSTLTNHLWCSRNRATKWAHGAIWKSAHCQVQKANFKNVENWKVLKMWGLLKQYVYYEDLMSVLKCHLCWLRNSTVNCADATVWLCALSCMTSSKANTFFFFWKIEKCSIWILLVVPLV